MSNIISIPQRHSFFSKKKSKRPLIIALVVCLVIGVCVGVYLLLNHQTKVEQKTQQTIQNYSDQVSTSIIKADYAAAESDLDKNLANASTDALKAWVYIQKSSVALNLAHYDDAYNFAKQAEGLSPTADSVKMMAAALEAKGDKAGALKYYKITLGRMIGTSGSDQLDRDDIQKKIDSLGGK